VLVGARPVKWNRWNGSFFFFYALSDAKSPRTFAGYALVTMNYCGFTVVISIFKSPSQNFDAPDCFHRVA